jgi:hypothetical protein
MMNIQDLGDWDSELRAPFAASLLPKPAGATKLTAMLAEVEILG